MTKKILSLVCVVALIGLSLTVPETEQCGEFSIGNYKLDLSRGEVSTEIARDKLNESIKQGFSFSGTSKCPGEYEVVDLLLIVHDDGNAPREYDLDLLRRMQTMDDYMLVRYFFNAQKLVVSDIQVKNGAGGIQSIPDLSLILK